ncbi:DUF6000 family protein [Streptomyces sp. 6N106]|uniref:DUF6000 family protein n=1 Tax=Streptomyces sp. 6N106 TaxID=3457418 RepID=UPI003FD0024C
MSAVQRPDVERYGYLDRYLPRPDLYDDQAAAFGTLLLLDGRLGAGQAARFLTPDGLWQQWIDGPPSKDSTPPTATASSSASSAIWLMRVPDIAWQEPRTGGAVQARPEAGSRSTTGGPTAVTSGSRGRVDAGPWRSRPRWETSRKRCRGGRRRCAARVRRGTPLPVRRWRTAGTRCPSAARC